MPYIRTERIKDDSVSEYITTWLSKYYFSKIFTTHTIVKDFQTQISGIDLYGDGKSIDIKAQASKKYLGNPTETFSVEISALDRFEHEIYGWFINPQMKNDYYMFVWIHDCVHNYGYISDINKVECMTVDKHLLLSEVACVYKSDINNNKNSYQLSRMMRENNIHNYYVGPLKFVCSNTLAEKPVNIVLSKSFLSEFSVRHDFVTKDSIEPIYN